MHRIGIGALGAIFIATTAMVSTPGDTEARSQKGAGGTTVVTTNRVWNGTLRDRSPWAGKAIVLLQKKSGRQKCRVNRIIFKRGGRRFWVGPFEKWARTYTRAGAWSFPNNGRVRDSVINVSIRTNGRCVVGVAIK